jgi:hypothetical protein
VLFLSVLHLAMKKYLPAQVCIAWLFWLLDVLNGVDLAHALLQTEVESVTLAKTF